MIEEPQPTPDKAKLAELMREFSSVPTIQSQCHASCPNCGGFLSERDRVGPGIGCFDLTTLSYCDKCGYYRVGATYWTTNY